MSFLGLDIGTSGCKAAAFNAEARLLASVGREYRISSPRPGWAEIDATMVSAACFDVLREAANATSADPVQALAISSQGEAFVPLDASDRPLLPAMVSSDQRAHFLVEPWAAEFGIERLYQKTGHTAHPIFSLFKLAWLRENEPAIWQRARRFLCFEDYLHLKLGLDPAISWSLAGRTMLFDVRSTQWDHDILNSLGLTPDHFARPLPSGSIVGTIPDAVANDLGLRSGVKVVTGGHDQVCAALGCGAIQAGQAALTTGTVECITLAFDQPVFDPALLSANLCTYSHAAPGLYATLAYNLTGGNLLRWFREQLGAAEQFEAMNSGRNVYDILLESMPREPSRLLALPYFAASGTPYFDATTPGALVGLRLDTSRAEILRGLLEGLAYELRLNISILEEAGITLRELYAVGGGAQNRSWLQLKADVLNRPILCPQVTEAGCLGTALLAFSAIQCTKLPVSAWVKIREVIEPSASLARHYADRFPDYAALYGNLKNLFARRPLAQA